MKCTSWSKIRISREITHLSQHPAIDKSGHVMTVVMHLIYIIKYFDLPEQYCSQVCDLKDQTSDIRQHCLPEIIYHGNITRIHGIRFNFHTGGNVCRTVRKDIGSQAILSLT